MNLEVEVGKGGVKEKEKKISKVDLFSEYDFSHSIKAKEKRGNDVLFTTGN